MAAKTIPNRLYKFRAFSNLTLEMLVGDSMYFADPSSFNDPLDTKPSLQTDINADRLAQMLSQLVIARVTAEMTAAARSIHYRGPRTSEHIARHSRLQAERLIEDIRYNATNPDYDFDDPEQFLFGHSVERELLRRYDRGIVSLATRVECPLMWSHYGDQHKGLCLGYAVPSDMADQIHKVRYGGSRLIRASLVEAMLNGDKMAQRAVDDAVLLRKAHAWNYEKEWRLIGARGPQNSQLELKDVVFGMRCDDAVKYAVVKALEDRQRPVRFHEIHELPGRFLLKKRALDVAEITHAFPRCHRAIMDAFADLDDLEPLPGSEVPRSGETMPHGSHEGPHTRTLR